MKSHKIAQNRSKSLKIAENRQRHIHRLLRKHTTNCLAEMYEQKTNVQDTTIVHLYDTKSLQTERGRFGYQENSEKHQSTPSLKWGAQAAKTSENDPTLRECI